MRAIAGVVHGDGRAIEASCLGPLMRSIAPDRAPEARSWHDGPAALIATTLDGLCNEGQGEAGIVTSFDGRLDNRAQLLDLLGDSGRILRSAPDSRIVAALFDRLGERFLQELVGDFAIAIWDERRRRLLLARSPTGWRPLLWTLDGARLGFATEPAALIRGLGISPALNEALLGEILAARFASETETPWRGIFRLAPGTALSFEKGEVRRWCWYNESYEDLSRLSDGEHVERFNALFDQAIIACMRSDRPVAAHLSGGLDSSAIVCRATELHRAGAIERQIGPVSVRYPGEPQDETRWSELVEQHLGIGARVVGDINWDIESSGDWCADTLQLPVRPNTVGPTLSVCRLMQEKGERVLLTGEGGDDWMNGSHAHWPDLLLSGRIGTLLQEAFAQGPGRPFAANLRSLLAESIGPIVSPARRARVLRPFLDTAAPLPPWIRPEWADRIGLEQRWRDAARPIDLPGFAQRARSTVIAPANRDLIFDPIQASAARHGVELRHPFYDLRLLRFFMGAAGGTLQRHGQRKHLLREAMRGTLPEPVRQRQDKARFPAPVIDALKTYFAQRPPTDLLAARMGWIDGAIVGRLFDEQRRWRESGLTGAAPNPCLAGLWFCVAVDIWLENAFGMKP